MIWPFDKAEPAPLAIAGLALPGGGMLGIAPCPGRHLDPAPRAEWRRDLDADLATVREWGASAVVTLMEAAELELFGVADIGSRCADVGLAWFHLPILDMAAPDARFDRSWPDVRRALAPHLIDEGRVLVHCLGGFGRSGTFAACLLVESGLEAPEAVRRVRSARPGAIQTPEQLDWILALAAI